VIDEFIKRHAKVNTRSWKATEKILQTHILPPWKSRPVQSIIKRDVHDVLGGIIARGKPIMANRVLAHTRKLFNWCVEQDIVTASPCADIRMPAREKSRDRVLDDRELRTVLLAARSLGWPFGALLELLVLTGCRLREAANMTWVEVDFDARLWHIPGTRTKNGKPLDLPLSNQAIAVLRSTPRIAGRSGYVFTLNGNAPIKGFSWYVEKLNKACAEPVAKWTLHDTRRVVASGMARLGVNLPVIEKCLNHSSGSFAGIVGVYQKHSFADEMRTALEMWGNHVEQLLSAQPPRRTLRG
jgi:integrase